MKNDKSFGLDGFFSEFFKFFWKDLGFFIIWVINNLYELLNFLEINKLGIIICIFKEGKFK